MTLGNSLTFCNTFPSVEIGEFFSLQLDHPATGKVKREHIDKLTEKREKLCKCRDWGMMILLFSRLKLTSSF